MAQISPFIRWAGGKTWLVPYVQELIEGLEFKNYHEPFMGGASIFLSIDVPQKSFLSDANAELVEAFCALRDKPRSVIGYLKEYKTDAESYYIIRDCEPKGKFKRAARFIYLNTYSFNGIYRVNRQGKYNVPYGKRGNIEIKYDRLLEASEKLKNAEIVCQDFADSKDVIQQGDLVFLDPPYTVSRGSNSMFIKYNSKLFSLDDQYRLAELIDYIKKRNAYFILTNAAHDTILEIFQDKGRMVTRERSSLIGGKNAYRGRVKEYVFTNIPEKGE